MRKYWDIISGAIIGLLLAFFARFELQRVQLCYSVIILMLVSIGFCKIIKQEVEKHRHKKERNHSIIDGIIDGQKPIKAVNFAQTPTKEGEHLGHFIINIFGGFKKMFEKFKVFFTKFKGYMLTIALAILSVIEMCGGYVNAAFGGVLTIKGIAVMPVITIACTAIVGIISNGYTKEQADKIKALFSKSTTDEIVIAEIKKTIKEKTANLLQFNKLLIMQEHELNNLESEFETLHNTLSAKKEMFSMMPQLATHEDVQLATTELANCSAKIDDKKAEIEKSKETISTLTTTINALKSQL